MSTFVPNALLCQFNSHYNVPRTDPVEKHVGVPQGRVIDNVSEQEVPKIVYENEIVAEPEHRVGEKRAENPRIMNGPSIVYEELDEVPRVSTVQKFLEVPQIQERIKEEEIEEEIAEIPKIENVERLPQREIEAQRQKTVEAVKETIIEKIVGEFVDEKTNVCILSFLETWNHPARRAATPWWVTVDSLRQCCAGDNCVANESFLNFPGRTQKASDSGKDGPRATICAGENQDSREDLPWEYGESGIQFPSTCQRPRATHLHHQKHISAQKQGHPPSHAHRGAASEDRGGCQGNNNREDRRKICTKTNVCMLSLLEIWNHPARRAATHWWATIDNPQRCSRYFFSRLCGR